MFVRHEIFWRGSSAPTTHGGTWPHAPPSCVTAQTDDFLSPTLHSPRARIKKDVTPRSIVMHRATDTEKSRRWYRLNRRLNTIACVGGLHVQYVIYLHAHKLHASCLPKKTPKRSTEFGRLRPEEQTAGWGVLRDGATSPLPPVRGLWVALLAAPSGPGVEPRPLNDLLYFEVSRQLILLGYEGRTAAELLQSGSKEWGLRQPPQGREGQKITKAGGYQPEHGGFNPRPSPPPEPRVSSHK